MLMNVEFQETQSIFNAKFTNVQPITVGDVIVDSELSTTSINPVQNKVITERIIKIETDVGNVDELLSTI